MNARERLNRWTGVLALVNLILGVAILLVLLGGAK